MTIPVANQHEIANTNTSLKAKTFRTWMNSRRNLLASPLVFLASFALYSLLWPYSLSDGWLNFRGGVSTVGAERVLEGAMPYRDFWTMYAPGHFYLLASIFRVFGAHLMVEVVAASILSAAAATLCYLFVASLTQRAVAALVVAEIFVLSMLNTGYFHRLGSYAPAILLILTTYIFVLFYYRSNKLRYLLFAGLSTGTLILFKHDVGGYTAIATGIGLSIFALVSPHDNVSRLRSLARSIGTYAASAALVAISLAAYYALAAGSAMWQDLVIFPLTDFPYARPETYPGLLPTNIFDKSGLERLQAFFNYININIPFLLFCCGLGAIVLAWRQNRPIHLALGATLAVGYLLHFSAAHVQINTHIVTMSLYGAMLGAILFNLIMGKRRVPTVTRVIITAFLVAWAASLTAQPAYMAWRSQQAATVELQMDRVSGFRLNPDEAANLVALKEYIDAHIPPGQALYVGLNRHDAIIIGDVLIYFILDRPIATRYHELHPAIADTSLVQQEIIRELQQNDVSVIVTKQIFSDDALDQVKADFGRNLPHVGATDLDEFIETHYREVQHFGPYSVWERVDHFTEAPLPPSSADQLEPVS